VGIIKTQPAQRRRQPGQAPLICDRALQRLETAQPFFDVRYASAENPIQGAGEEGRSSVRTVIATLRKNPVSRLRVNVFSLKINASSDCHQGHTWNYRRPNPSTGHLAHAIPDGGCARRKLKVSMEAVLFDTMTFVDTLRNDGHMPENQAKAIAKALGVALHQGVATHEDITEVKTLVGAVDARVTLLETRMEAGFSNLEAKMDGQRIGLEAKISTGLSSLETKVDGQKTSLEAMINVQKSSLEAKLKIQQFWIYIVVGLTALTNPIALHIYRGLTG
jgi:hypothetical protein